MNSSPRSHAVSVNGRAWPRSLLILAIFMAIFFALQTVAVPAVSASGTITGTAFRDYDADAVKDTLEPGIEGVEVRAYDASGANVTTGSVVLTGPSGSYTLIATGTGPYRIEFKLPADGSLDFLKPGAAGGTTVQFVPDGSSSNINVGYNNPIDYCQVAPDLVTPQTVFGPLANVSGVADRSMVAIGYTDDGDLSQVGDVDVLANLSDTGTLYGMIYQRKSDLLLGGAYFKTYADLSPDGPGAIFATDYAVAKAGTPNAALYADLNNIKDPGTNAVIPGNPAGVDPRRTGAHDYDTGVCPDEDSDSAGNELGCWVHDPAGWAPVGAIGLGDLEEDDNEDFVFVVNLGDKRLYQLPIDDNSANWPLDTLAASPVPIPHDCAVASDAVPGGLGFKDGLLYVGVTCTAKSTQNLAQLKSDVFVFDPVLQSFNPTPVMTIDLTYPRGCVWADNPSINAPKTPTSNCQAFIGTTVRAVNNAAWNPWPQTWQQHYEGNAGANAPGIYGWTYGSPNQRFIQLEYPHPWLSDIAFDNDDMLIGFRDINGDRTGDEVRTPNIGEPTKVSQTATDYAVSDISDYEWVLDGAGFGDLLRACWNGSSWDLESNGSCGGDTTEGEDNGQGPGGGEWYWDDSGPGSRNPSSEVLAGISPPNYFGHEQTLMGGVFQRAGGSDVAVTMSDQLTYGDGGITRFSNIDNNPDIGVLPALNYPTVVNNDQGLGLNRTRLYATGSITPPAYFGKANGLGDMEGICDPAPIEIGNYVWFDANVNGRQDPGELPISGVVVQLFKGNTKVAETTTNSNGFYLFSYSGNPNLPTHTENWSFTGDNSVLPETFYEIRISTTQGSLSSTQFPTLSNADEDQRDSDGLDIGTDLVGVNFTTGNAGANNHQYDFGFVGDEQLVSLGDQVWFDANNNGVIDGLEQGINGVVVNLYADTNGDGFYTPGVDSFVSTTTTATNGPDLGYYEFTGLTPGDYVVVIPASEFAASEPLNGMASSTGNNPTPDPDDDVDDDDNGYAFVGHGVASQAVTLTSGGEPGTPNTHNPTIDFGFFGLGAIGNYVWVDENSDGYQDAGEPGIPNVQVILKNGQGTEIARTLTDSHGGYLFDNLPPGSYFVDIDESTIPTGMTQTPPSTLAGSDFGNQNHGGSGYPVTIGGGSPLENLTADFGYNYNPADDVNDPPSNPGAVAALGDRVWIDSDGDGKQDPEEVGVEGVELTLFSPGPDGLWGTLDDVNEGTTTTDENGYYLFDGLVPGSYKVTVTGTGTSHDVLNETLYTQTGDPDHFATQDQTVANNDRMTTVPVVLGPGDVFLNADFGFMPDGAELGSIGDTIWFDADADGNGPAIAPVDGGSPVTQGAGGTADPSEYGIPGVTVVLIRDLNGDGEWTINEPIIATDVTDANGQYLFADLSIASNSNDYIVWVNDTNNVLGELVPTYDKDGAGAPPAGLRTGLGISAVTDLTATTVRDQDFGYTATGQQPPNGDDLPTGLVGDTIWYDTDRGGTQNGNEPGIEGVVVQLYNATGTTLLATTTTDENGHYAFGGLPLGVTYQVRVPASNFANGGPLEGTTNTGDPEGDFNNVTQATLTVGSPIDLLRDFGYVAPDQEDGSIGNLVWEDVNADGVWQNGEAGIDGVTIDLYRDLNGNGQVDPGEPLMGTTTTAGGGAYLFDNLPIVGGGDNDPEAEYVVDVTDVNGVLFGYWHSLSANQDANTEGGNDAADNSKVDPFAVEIGGTGGQPVADNRNVDFGYYVIPGCVGNYVWSDTGVGGGTADDGIFNEDATAGINGVEVTLTITYPDGTVVVLKTLTADDESGNPGYYSFCNLLLDEDYNGDYSGSDPNEPAYVLSVVPPSSFPYSTEANGGAPDNVGVEQGQDNNADITAGEPGFPFQGGTDNTNDFGFSTTPTAVDLLSVGAASAQLSSTVWAVLSALALLLLGAASLALSQKRQAAGG